MSGKRFLLCPECDAPGLDNPRHLCAMCEQLRYWPPRQLHPQPEPRRAA